MAILIADRVQETSTSPGGTGTLTLTGSPVPGYKSFSSGIGTGNSFYYTIYDAVTYAWEVGIGSWTANVLTRTTVLSNSLNTTALISFTNGNTLNVWVDYPASSAVAQTDVGSAPNQIPLNQYLGSMAYEDKAGVNISGGTAKFTTTIGVGNATPSTSGSGVSFPATQSASTDPNTLDDYEEGTFTPTYTSWTINPTTSNAFYTKIGRQVTINMLCAEGVTAGSAIIGGLPFTSRANQGATATIRGINSNINGVGAIVDNSAQIQNIGAMTNTGYFWTLSVTYIV